MTLSALIRKRDPGSVATAIPAIPATQQARTADTIAGIATVAVATPGNVEAGPTRRWRVHFQNLDPVEVIFTPDATLVEVMAIYPGAKIDPLPEPIWRVATAAEATELQALVEVVLANAPQEWDEVHRTACADPEAALISFRLLAADLPPVLDYSRFDLPTCEQCGNLAQYRGRDGFRRCAAARRRELPFVAQRDYSPVNDLPRRCEGFAPKPGDPDQRSGRDRWLALSPNGPTHE